MSLVWCSVLRAVRYGCAAALMGTSSLMLVGQEPSGAAASSAPADATPAACASLSDGDVPLNTVIQAKVNGLMQASRSKVGKDIWFTAAHGIVFPGCSLEADASLYARVTAASASKNPSASELGLEFDRADCRGHNKQPMKMFLIGMIAPPEFNGDSSHDAMPSEVHGGSRDISQMASDTFGYDERLNPGGPRNTVKPGAVVGFKHVKLEPQGGPQCSARISSTDKNIELPPGTILILAPRLEAK